MSSLLLCMAIGDLRTAGYVVLTPEQVQQHQAAVHETEQALINAVEKLLNFMKHVCGEMEHGTSVDWQSDLKVVAEALEQLKCKVGTNRE